jgi:hypothetical protein
MCEKSITVQYGSLNIDFKPNNEIIVDSEKVAKFPLTVYGVYIRKVTTNNTVGRNSVIY